MKQWISLLLIAVFLLAATGCVRQTTPPELPVTFYYLAADTVYDGESTVLHKEIRDAAEYESDLVGLMDLYLKGPVSETFRSPFPRGVTVTRYAATANMINLELSSEFAQLSGINLTLACACLANTLFDLTELERVQILVTDAQLDGQTSITLDRDDILYWDDSSRADETTLPADTSGN